MALLIIFFGLILLLLWGLIESAKHKEMEEYQQALMNIKNKDVCYTDSKTIIINIPKGEDNLNNARRVR